MITAAMFDKTFTPAASTLISRAAAWLAEASCVCLCNLPGPLRRARSCLFLLLAQLTASWLVMEAYGSGGKTLKKNLGLLEVGESNGEGFPVWIWLGLGCCERLETLHRVYEWLQCAPLYSQILLLQCIACLLWSRALPPWVTHVPAWSLTRLSRTRHWFPPTLEFGGHSVSWLQLMSACHCVKCGLKYVCSDVDAQSSTWFTLSWMWLICICDLRGGANIVCDVRVVCVCVCYF